MAIQPELMMILAGGVSGAFMMKIRAVEGRISSRFSVVESTLQEILFTLQVEQARLTDCEKELERRFDDFHRRQSPNMIGKLKTKK